MNELVKMLKDFQGRGYEEVSISNILIWISEIKKRNKTKRRRNKANE